MAGVPDQRGGFGCSAPAVVVLLSLASITATAQAQEAPGPPKPAEPSELQDAPEPSKQPFIELPQLFQPGLFGKYYAVPDLAPDALLLPKLNTSFLTMRPGIELLLDWTSLGQDDISRAQVGEQSDLFEVRAATIKLRGEFGLHQRVSYKVSIEYNGFDVNPEDSWAVTDFALYFGLPKWGTTVSIGQMRESFGYEVVGSIVVMPQSERIISPFASPINPGIKVAHVIGDNDRMTVTYGLYKNDWGEGDGSISFAGRITRLMIDEPQNRRFLHLGVAVRLSGDNPAQRYFGNPGVNATDAYVDTGTYAAKRARHLGVEAHYSQGPWSVMGEYVMAKTDAPEVGDPRFQGFYVLGSWVVTGESRAYDRAHGELLRLVPKGRWGALELFARFASVDLNDAAIAGGRYTRIEAGANWWATTRWKLGIVYGNVKLDRFDQVGTTNSLLTRLQWVY